MKRRAGAKAGSLPFCDQRCSGFRYRYEVSDQAFRQAVADRLILWVGEQISMFARIGLKVEELAPTFTGFWIER